jgi:O-antigen ligase
MVVTGCALAVALVVAIDSLSEESSGRWTANAVTFVMDLGTKDSTSKVTREIEWGHAIDVWKRSPIVGLGFGYPFPVITYGTTPESVLPDRFYMHNSYLNVLAKCGALGLCVLLYVVARTLSVVRGLLQRQLEDLEVRVLATALAASLVQMVMLAVFTPVLTTSDTIMYFAMLIGIAVAARRVTLREAS